MHINPFPSYYRWRNYNKNSDGAKTYLHMLINLIQNIIFKPIKMAFLMFYNFVVNHINQKNLVLHPSPSYFFNSKWIVLDCLENVIF